jgi:hypothetical protein
MKPSCDFHMELRSTAARKVRMLVDHHEHINIDGRPALRIHLNPEPGKPKTITLRCIMRDPAVKSEPGELHRRRMEDLTQELRRAGEVLRRPRIESLGRKISRAEKALHSQRTEDVERKIRRAEKALHRLKTQTQTTGGAGKSQTLTSTRQPRSGSQPRVIKVRRSKRVLPELTQDQMKTEEED